jgi:hypothetical protein
VREGIFVGIDVLCKVVLDSEGVRKSEPGGFPVNYMEWETRKDIAG